MFGIDMFKALATSCLIGALMASGVANADPIERVLSSPVVSVYCYGQTTAQVSSIVSSGNYRIVDLQVESVTSSGPLFTVVMVANTGVYGKGWWWYVGQTVSQVSASLSSNNARLISIAPYVMNGTTYFASVMVPNTGADAKSWYWWVGTAAQIEADVSTSGARIVDLEPFVNAVGTTNYVAIALGNTGADAASWWWYLTTTETALQNDVTANNAQLLTFDTDPGSNTFDSVMQGNPTAPWYFYAGISPGSLDALAIENGARLTQLRSNFVSGVRNFNTIMIDNASPCTSRVIGIQHANGAGWNGDYLKQISGAAIADGPVLCDAADARAFDPASALETVIGAYVMTLVNEGVANLNDKVPVLDSKDYCNFQPTGATETLRAAVTLMLKNSSNARADMLLQRYQLSTLTSYAQSIGMTNTQFNSYLGCGGVHNTMTLDDAAALYTGLAKNTILPAARKTALFGMMAGRDDDVSGMWAGVQSIISQEAPSSVTAAQLSNFTSQVTLTYKSGKFAWPSGIADLNGQTEYGDEGIDGVVQIPYCKAGTTQELREYVFGFFHESIKSTADQTPVFNAMGDGAEMLREQLRTALGTWKKCG